MVLYNIEQSEIKSIKEDLLIYILDKNLEAVKNVIFGDEYHVSVYLEDGTYLPCVVLRHRQEVENILYNNLHQVIYSGITSKRKRDQEDV